MSIDNVKLKPCPFCGGEAEIVRYSDHSILYFGSCKSCFSTGSSSTMKEKAIENWNRRAEPETIVNNGTMNITM